MTFCFQGHLKVGPPCLQPLLLCLWGDWRTLMGEEPSQQALGPDRSPPEPAQDESTVTPPAVRR